MDSRASVVAVVGPSGAGKTTLLERLIPALEARGLVVAAVKHASHGFEADRPGKDSQRLFESGARAVALASPERMATFVRRPVPGRPRLRPVLETLPAPLDVVLVEGFSWEPVPRIVVVAESGPPKPQDLRGGEVIEVVGAPRTGRGGWPLYDPALVEGLASRLELRVREESRPLRPASVDPGSLAPSGAT